MTTACFFANALLLKGKPEEVDVSRPPVYYKGDADLQRQESHPMVCLFEENLGEAYWV